MPHTGPGPRRALKNGPARAGLVQGPVSATVRVLLLVAALLLAGCSAPSEEKPPLPASFPLGDDPGYTAKHAARVAQEYGDNWMEGAILVGLEAQEIAPGARGRAVPPGIATSTDPTVGNGRAPYWIAGLRGPAHEFLLLVVTDVAKEIPRGGDHALATSFTELTPWRLDSGDAFAAAWAEADLAGGTTYALLRMQGPEGAERPVWTIEAGHPKVTVTINAQTGQVQTSQAPAATEARAAFALFVDMQRVSFNDPRYDVEKTQYLDAHLKIGEPNGDAIIHLKGHGVSFSQFLGSLGISYQSRVLQLDEGHGGTQWTDTNESYARLYVDHGDGAGFQRADNGPTHVLAAGQRILLTYASDDQLTASQLRAQQQAVASIRD